MSGIAASSAAMACAPGVTERLLAEYGLSTREGVALTCLAEALLGTPDAETLDALIVEKIAPRVWGAHLGRASGRFRLDPRQRLHLGADADRPGAGARDRRRRRRAAGPRAPGRRAGHPPRGGGGDARDGRAVRAGPRHGRGLRLQLRHAGRDGAHRGRRAAPPRRLPRRGEGGGRGGGGLRAHARGQRGRHRGRRRRGAAGHGFLRSRRRGPRRAILPPCAPAASAASPSPPP